MLVMNVKLLLDENLSPRVAEILRRDGIDVCAVRDRGLLEATDPEVFYKAFDEDRIVVTANVGDFEELARHVSCMLGSFSSSAGTCCATSRSRWFVRPSAQSSNVGTWSTPCCASPQMAR
jgi:uncharacterized protein with PIN domain